MRVAITGAAGQIGYAILFRIANALHVSVRTVFRYLAEGTASVQVP